MGTNRFAKCNPMNPIPSEPLVFLPRDHPITKMAMTDAHTRGHGGRDATCAKFREKYWTTSATKLAKYVKERCQTCKLRDAVLLKQCMGSLPEERLKPAPAFTYTMVDLFGPYGCRGEVNKRTTGKTWGVIFTCLGSRAVHIEACCGYDASNFCAIIQPLITR